jgi:hypothetical protein
MSLESKVVWIAFFGGVILIYALFMVFARWCYGSPAVPMASLKRLRVGMDTQEVRQLLGPPRAEVIQETTRVWRYGHRLKRHVLMVSFDASGRVLQFEHGAPPEPEHADSN